MSKAYWTRKRIPPVAVAAIFVMLGLAVGYACLEAFAPNWLRPTDKGERLRVKGPNLIPPPGPPTAPPLTVGDKPPPLNMEGWLNGPPPAEGSTAPRLLVIDVWAPW